MGRGICSSAFLRLHTTEPNPTAHADTTALPCRTHRPHASSLSWIFLRASRIFPAGLAPLPPPARKRPPCPAQIWRWGFAGALCCQIWLRPPRNSCECSIRIGGWPIPSCWSIHVISESNPQLSTPFLTFTPSMDGCPSFLSDQSIGPAHPHARNHERRLDRARTGQKAHPLKIIYLPICNNAIAGHFKF